MGQPWLSVYAGWQTWVCFDDVAAAARGVLCLRGIADLRGKHTSHQRRCSAGWAIVPLRHAGRDGQLNKTSN